MAITRQTIGTILWRVWLCLAVIAILLVAYTFYSVAYAYNDFQSEPSAPLLSEYWNEFGVRFDLGYGVTVEGMRLCTNEDMTSSGNVVLEFYQGNTGVASRSVSLVQKFAGQCQDVYFEPITMSGASTWAIAMDSATGGFAHGFKVGNPVAGACVYDSSIPFDRTTCDGFGGGMDARFSVYGRACTGEGCEYTHTDILYPQEGSTTASVSFDVTLEYYADTDDTGVSDNTQLVLFLCNLSAYQVSSPADFGLCEFWVIDPAITQNTSEDVTDTVVALDTGYYYLVSGLWNGVSYGDAALECPWWNLVCYLSEQEDPEVIALSYANVIVASTSATGNLAPEVDPRTEAVAKYCGSDDGEWWQVLDNTAFGVCQSLVMLFMPTSVGSGIDSMTDTLKSKVPFGFFYATQEYIGGIATVASSSPPDVELQVLGASMSVVDWSAYKSSPMSGWVAVLSPYITALIWIFFTMHIFDHLTGRRNVNDEYQ